MVEKSSRVRREVQCKAVDAVAKAGRRRAVWEHVPEMTTALAAVDLGPHHAVSPIHRFVDRALQRREEARPAGAAFELAFGPEQRLPATGADKRAFAILVEQRAGTGWF